MYLPIRYMIIFLEESKAFCISLNSGVAHTSTRFVYSQDVAMMPAAGAAHKLEYFYTTKELFWQVVAKSNRSFRNLSKCIECYLY